MKIGNTEYIEIIKGKIGSTGRNYPDGCYINYEIKTDHCIFNGVEYIDLNEIDKINAVINQIKTTRSGSHDVEIGYDGDLNLMFSCNRTNGSVDLIIEARSLYHDKFNQFREQRISVSFLIEGEWVESIKKL